MRERGRGSKTAEELEAEQQLKLVADVMVPTELFGLLLPRRAGPAVETKEANE